MNITDALLTNKIPRPQVPLDLVKAIVLHWPAVLRQRAMEVRNYWEGETNKVGSAHFVIDIDGTILRTIPETEKAYAVGSTLNDPASKRVYTDMARNIFGDYASGLLDTSPNRCTISMELCHVGSDGLMTSETVISAIELCAELCKRYNLTPFTEVITHHDVVGWKDCPRWFVLHPDDLDEFRRNVSIKMGF